MGGGATNMGSSGSSGAGGAGADSGYMANGMNQNLNGNNNMIGANGVGAYANEAMGMNGANQANLNESNQMFEKILSEVIHVPTLDQRANTNNDSGSHFVQEMPFKLKSGFLEPNKSQLSLPEGVPAPLILLAAQPPFISDIRLINYIAQEANACINNFSLHVPENVAFDFKPIA
jgi:hypothetical protein